MAGLLVQIGVLVGTLGAAAIAWWQAIVATQARRDADESQTRAERAAERATSAFERSASAGEFQAQVLAESNDLARSTWSEQRERTEREHRHRVATIVEKYAYIAIERGANSAQARAAWVRAESLARRFNVGAELVQWAIETVPYGVAAIEADPDDPITRTEWTIAFGMTARGYVDDPQEFLDYRAEIRAERSARGPINKIDPDFLLEQDPPDFRPDTTS